MKINKKIILLVIVFILIIGVVVSFNSKKFPSASDTVNDYLDNLFISLDQKNIDYTFEKSKNKRIASAIVKIEYPSEDDKYIIPYFVSYNVDVKSGELLSKEQTADYYGYSLDDVIEKINMRLKTYYDEEVKLGYVDSNECGFEQYKNFYRNIEDIDSIYELYVKNNKLYAYVSFDINSINEDIDYFQNLKYDPFEIEL